MMEGLFLLSWRKFSIVLAVFIAFFFFRNLFGRLVGVDGSIFANIGLLILGYLLICVIYVLFSVRKMGKKRGKKKKVKGDLFLLNWRKFGLIMIAWIVVVAVHNFGSALIGFEEPVFFIIAVIVIPVYFVVAVVYTLVKVGIKMRGRK